MLLLLLPKKHSWQTSNDLPKPSHPHFILFFQNEQIINTAVSITDNASVIFGGSDAPTALAGLYSIGSIAMEANGAITKDVTDLLEPFGLDEDRIYINFFDVPRANVGWSRRTFAG